MNLLERKKFRKNIKAIVDANQSSISYLDSLSENYRLTTEDENNLRVLQEHLSNMTVIFSGMKNEGK